MNITYLLREGVSGFKRARLSMFIAIFTITISLFLLGLFASVYRNVNTIINSFREKVEMEAFLAEPITDSLALDIQYRVSEVRGVESITYISKEHAAKIFRQEFGEDITKVLDFNPLPPSLKIHLQHDYKNSDSARVLYGTLKEMHGIENVIYRKALLEILDRRARLYVFASASIGITFLIIALFLVYNTIRLTIDAKRKIITTMKLVGATHTFIRLPFLVEGMVQGLIGGLISSALIYTLTTYLGKLLGAEFADFVAIHPLLYVALCVLGIVLGLIGSFFSVRKYISESASVQ